MNDYGFKIHDIGYTRVTQTTKSAIDWIATNYLAEKITKNLNTLKCGFSDHDFITGHIKKVKIKKEYKILKKLVLSKKATANFCNELIKLNSQNGIENYLLNVNHLVNTCFQVRFIKKPILNVNDHKIILSESFVNTYKKRNKYLKRFKDTGNEDDKLIYKNLKYKCRKIANMDKKRYYDEVSKECIRSKKPWNLLNKLNKKNDPKEDIKKIKINNTTHTNKLIISNLLNNHFSTIIQKLNSNFGYKPTKLELINKNGGFNFCRISVGQFLVALKLIKQSNFTEEYNSIPQMIFARFQDIFSNILTIFFNNIIESGNYPTCLKISKVIPLYKSGVKDSLENYRPIAMLPTINKIFERILHNQLMSYIEKNDYLNSKQFGFRKSLNTDMALNILLKHILNKIELNHKIVVVFLDFSKAFDSLDHNCMINKLNQKFGITSHSCMLLLSYLTNRKQFTSIGTLKSSENIIDYGVPQGSILGPLLFILFINDIVDCIEDGNMVLYADDSVLIISDKDVNSLVNKVNLNLNNINNYCMKNHLFLNIKKTKILQINFTENIDTKIYLNNEIVEIATDYKYLGFIIDSRLKFNLLVESLLIKLNSLNYFIARMSKFLNVGLLMLLCKAFIFSQIIYYKTVILNLPIGQKQKIQSKLNRSEAIIFNKKLKYCEGENFNLEKIVKNYKILQIHKIIHSINENEMKKHLNKLSKRTCNIKAISSRKGSSKMNFEIYIPKLWNALPIKLKRIDNYTLFKHELFFD